MEQTTPAENPFQSPAEKSLQSPAVDSGSYADKPRDRHDSELGTGHLILAALCGGIACIVGIIWMLQDKPKGIKMVGAAIMFIVFWNAVHLAASYVMNL